MAKKAPQIIEKGVPTGMPNSYVDGVVNMSAQMITTKEAFVRLWGKRLKKHEINPAWEKAEKWRKQFDKVKGVGK